MYPMDFEEFCWAMGGAFKRQMMKAVRSSKEKWTAFLSYSNFYCIRESYAANTLPSSWGMETSGLGSAFVTVRVVPPDI